MSLETLHTFCRLFGLDLLPFTSDILCLFLVYLHRTIKCPGSLQNYISGLKYYCNLLGQDITIFAEFQVKLTLRAIKRTTLHVPRSKLPITLDVLYRLYLVMEL